MTINIEIMNKTIAIIDYGAGNIKSVKYALERLGVQAILTSDPEEIKKADKVIFPGVGQASAAMQQLKNKGLDKLIPSLTQPVLGICLGMQLMCEHTEEGDTKGLGIFPNNVLKFPQEDKVPHMGWNSVENMKSDLLKNIKENDYVYFVHSFYVPTNTYSIADCNYIKLFCAALQKENFYGCQFHPEKSGKTGEKILKNFLNLK